MLAEIFMIRMEAIARVAKEAVNSRFVPIALPAPKAPERIVFAAPGENEARVPSPLY